MHKPTELLMFNAFLEFLKARVRMLEIREETIFKPKDTSTPKRSSQKQSALPANPAIDPALKLTCVICKQDHLIYNCEEFKKLSVEQRFEK